MDPHANLEEQLAISGSVLATEDEWPDEAVRLAELVVALHEWRRGGGFDPYLPALQEDAFPNHVQAIALGRFLRGRFSLRDPSMRRAVVSRGGAGLPDTYLHVLFNDGYEGGVDFEGRVST